MLFPVTRCLPYFSISMSTFIHPQTAPHVLHEQPRTIKTLMSLVRNVQVGPLSQRNMQQFLANLTMIRFLTSLSVPEPTPSTMTALHQFGAEMLKLSKRLESYPTAPVSAKESTLLGTTSRLAYNSHVPADRLIRSTTNASIVNQHANNNRVMGDDTHVHYNTRDHYDSLYCENAAGSIGPRQSVTAISNEQAHRRYGQSTCKAQDQKLFATCQPIRK